MSQVKYAIAMSKTGRFNSRLNFMVVESGIATESEAEAIANAKNESAGPFTVYEAIKVAPNGDFLGFLYE